MTKLDYVWPAAEQVYHNEKVKVVDRSNISVYLFEWAARWLVRSHWFWWFWRTRFDPPLGAAVRLVLDGGLFSQQPKADMSSCSSSQLVLFRAREVLVLTLVFFTRVRTKSLGQCCSRGNSDRGWALSWTATVWVEPKGSARGMPLQKLVWPIRS